MQWNQRVPGLDVVDDAKPDWLARYDHPHFGQWPAITTREVGQGRITYVGTVPSLELAKAVMRWACPAHSGGWRNLPETVTATGATARDGRRLRFLHNWSWDPASVSVPVPVTDAVGPDGYASGESVQLGAWDVRVLVEGEPDGNQP